MPFSVLICYAINVLSYFLTNIPLFPLAGGDEVVPPPRNSNGLPPVLLFGGPVEHCVRTGRDEQRSPALSLELRH